MSDFRLISINWNGGGNAVIFTNTNGSTDIINFINTFYGVHELPDETIINYFIDNGFLCEIVLSTNKYNNGDIYKAFYNCLVAPDVIYLY